MNIYYEEFINFFKKHDLYNEELFNNIRLNSYLFDYRDDEKRAFIGCYCNTNSNDTIKDITLCVPFIDSKKTILINIHEYIHALILYQYLNKKYKITIDSEILPILYETLYILENPTEELKEFQEKLNSKIDKENNINYQIALKVQNELLKYYKKSTPNLQKLQSKAKKLARKCKRKSI